MENLKVYTVADSQCCPNYAKVKKSFFHVTAVAMHLCVCVCVSTIMSYFVFAYNVYTLRNTLCSNYSIKLST